MTSATSPPARYPGHPMAAHAHPYASANIKTPPAHQNLFKSVAAVFQSFACLRGLIACAPSIAQLYTQFLSRVTRLDIAWLLSHLPSWLSTVLQTVCRKSKFQRCYDILNSPSEWRRVSCTATVAERAVGGRPAPGLRARRSPIGTGRRAANCEKTQHAAIDCHYLEK